MASLIGADAKEVVFTSGATESNNIAIKGAANFYGSSGKKHIITTQTEHKCVLDSCRSMQQQGFEVTYLPVQQDGLVNLDELEAAIRPDTILVSVMFVNNEIGVLQPIEAIGKICKKNKIFLHVDAAQASYSHKCVTYFSSRFHSRSPSTWTRRRRSARCRST